MGTTLDQLAETHDHGGGFVARLSDEARADLAASGIIRQVGRDQVLFLQGELHGRVGVMLDGVVKVTAAGDDGREAFLGLRGPGDVVGLTTAISGDARISTATSLTPTSIRLLTAAEFDAFTARHPSARSSVTAVLAARVREAVAWRVRAADPAPVRLAAALLDLARRHGCARDDGAIVLDLALTQDDLAMLVATSRDSVAKTLMAWRRTGLVETQRRALVLLDGKALAALR